MLFKLLMGCNMFKWLFRKSDTDKNEEMIKSLLSFLLTDYGFQYIKKDLGNAIDKNGKFFFYGPLYTYSIYNENVCINVLYLVQRQDFEIFITDTYKPNQIYIRNGTSVSDYLAYHFEEFAEEIKSNLIVKGEVYGRLLKSEKQ